MERHKVTDECRGMNCKKIDGEYCLAYPNPAYWWEIRGRCPIPSITKEAEEKFKLNPLKASKQQHKGNLNLGYKLRRYQHSKKYKDGITERAV